MGQPVDVVVSELHSAAARLEHAAQRLQDGLASVNDETTQLLAADWKGEAASAYGPAWNQWHEGATKVIEGLQRMSELLDIAGKEYTRTDESAADGVGSTMQSSGGSSGSGGGDPVAGAAGGTTASPTAAGSASSTGAAGSTSAPAGDGFGQAVSSASQLGQAATQPLSQAGSAVAGLVQTAAQLATGLAQQAGQTGTDSKEPASATDEDRRDDQRERPEGHPEVKTDNAAPAGEQATGAAPLESESIRRGETPLAVERPGE